MVDVLMFVVRVWRQQHPFRASVRSVDDDEPRCFSTPEQLAEFLRAAASASGQRGTLRD